jgi:hypothetical protein
MLGLVCQHNSSSERGGRLTAPNECCASRLRNRKFVDLYGSFSVKWFFGLLPVPCLARLSQLDPDLGNFADGLNGNWLIGLVRSRKNSGKAAAVPTK